jgi:hypothetical protein
LASERELGLKPLELDRHNAGAPDDRALGCAGVWNVAAAAPEATVNSILSSKTRERPTISEQHRRQNQTN